MTLESHLKCTNCENTVTITSSDGLVMTYTEFQCIDCSHVIGIGESLLLSKRRKKGYQKPDEVERYEYEKDESTKEE